MSSRLFGAALVLALLAPALSAQPLWRAAPAGAAVSLDAMKRFPTRRFQFTDERGEVLGDLSESVFTAAYAVSARVPVGGRWAVVAEVPVSYYALTTDAPFADLDESDSFSLGNPALGVEADVPFGAATDRVRVRAEVRLPLADGRATFAAFDGAAPFRYEAYTSETASVAVSADLSYGLTESLRVDTRLAPVFSVMDTGPFSDDPDANLGVLWAAHLRGEVGSVSLGVGAVGRWGGTNPMRGETDSRKRWPGPSSPRPRWKRCPCVQASCSKPRLPEGSASRARPPSSASVSTCRCASSASRPRRPPPRPSPPPPWRARCAPSTTPRPRRAPPRRRTPTTARCARRR